MNNSAVLGTAAALLVTGSITTAQEGIGRNGPDGSYRNLSEGLKVIGGFDFAESCSYDPSRDVIVAPNMGNRIRDGFFNDGWVSLINHDGSVHTLQFIRGGDDSGAWINDPFGSDIVDGVLYLADTIGGTGDDDPPVAVISMFDMATGEMRGMHEVPGSTGFNDIEVDDDGTIFASQTGANDAPDTWHLWRISRDGDASLLVRGAPLARPNGVAIDNDGNVVVANLGSNNLFTFDREGNLLKTEHTVDGVDDGLIVMEDGTKYVSSVRYGSISRIPPNGEAELIAVGMPGGASMCYDPIANQLVVPMNNANALVLVPLAM